MIHEGSAARAYAMAPQTETNRPQPSRRPFKVMEGDGLDAHDRAPVDATFIRRVRYGLLALGLMLVLGVARVAICTGTVATLSANQDLKAQVSEAVDAAGELRIENSVLSNATRVTRIATENYGMVYAGAGESLDVTVPAR